MINLNEHRIRSGLAASDDSLGRTGSFQFGALNVLAFFPDPFGWEHVIVSRLDQTPTWDEMCFVKDCFWAPEEMVWQYHPPASQASNIHPYALHMWRKLGFEFPMPPSVFSKGQLTNG